MKCTNRTHHLKIKLLCISCIAALFMNGCGTGKTADIQNPYSLTGDNSSVSNQFFARNLCVTDDINFGTDQVHADYAEGAGVFDLTTKEVLYSQNLFEKLYPASTTKILTAYIIIRNCDLDDKVTVSADAIANMADSSKCGLAAGDVLTVRDLLYHH